MTAAAQVDLKFVDETIQRIGTAPDAVLPILQAMQEFYGYLPEVALVHISRHTRIRPAAIAGVASFYDMFRRQPAGKHIVRVCRGTACHVTGAQRVEDALRRHLGIGPSDDTDPERRFTIEPVACLGCCTLAPVVKIGSDAFGHASAEKIPSILQEFAGSIKKNGDSSLSTEGEPVPFGNGQATINIGLGSCCMAKGSDQLLYALRRGVEQMGAEVAVKRVGCVGM